MLREESDVDDEVVFSETDEYDSGSEGENDDSEGEEDHEVEGSGDEGSEDGSEGEVSGEEGSASKRENDSDSGSGVDSDGEEKIEASLFTYKPVAGEDIYGRKIDTPAGMCESEIICDLLNAYCVCASRVCGDSNNCMSLIPCDILVISDVAASVSLCIVSVINATLCYVVQRMPTHPRSMCLLAREKRCLARLMRCVFVCVWVCVLVD